MPDHRPGDHTKKNSSPGSGLISLSWKRRTTTVPTLGITRITGNAQCWYSCEAIWDLKANHSAFSFPGLINTNSWVVPTIPNSISFPLFFFWPLHLSRSCGTPRRPVIKNLLLASVSRCHIAELCRCQDPGALSVTELCESLQSPRASQRAKGVKNRPAHHSPPLQMDPL